MNLKNVLFILFFGLSSTSLFAQNAVSKTIKTNNVKAVINSNGALFWDFNDGQFVTATDNATELSTLRASGLWLGGVSPVGNLRGATQLYNENGKADFIPGALHSMTGEVVELNKIWEVTAHDIDRHRADFADNGVIDSPNAHVYAWPARGNQFFSEYNDGMELPNTTQGLAAFWDINGNGFYDPNEGDFPILEIRGCFDAPVYPTEMWWFVFNDNVSHTESSLESMNMEVQCQVFAYACEEESPINNTIFVRHKLIYRGTEPLDNTHFGVYSDFDIGNSMDDFFGSDATRSLVFAYNGDDNDEGGYGTNPPAMAIDFFRQPLSEMGLEQNLTYVMPVPANENLNGTEMYNLLSGLNIDGTPASNDGFFYNGDPNNANEDSEVSSGNAPGERRVLASSSAFRLDPGAVNELISAYTFHQETGQTSLQNVATMYEQNDQIQALFDNCFDASAVSCSQAVAIQEVFSATGKIFPNPATDELNIWLETGTIQDLKLLDFTGKTLLSQKVNRESGQYILDTSSMANGMYLVQIVLKDGRIFKEKVVVMND